MVAAAVVLPQDFESDGIRDSKQLTAHQREEAYERIVEGALAYAVCRVESAAIDRRGLHKSNIALLRRAVRSLDPVPDYALTDGFPVPRMPCPSLSIKKGDAVTLSVAAASILAKVTRDKIMLRMHKRFPEFGFDRNKGYGSAEHLAAIAELGPTAVHRLSFQGVGQSPLPGLGVPASVSVLDA